MWTLLDSISSVQFSCSVVSDFATPWTAASHASLSITNPQSFLKLISIKSVMHPTILSSVAPFSSCLQSFPTSGSFPPFHIRWPNYWRFSFSISPSSEFSGQISFRMEWLDLLAVHGTLTSLLQHHSSKASIRRHSAFLTVQLSHPYMTTGKTISLTRWTSVVKVMSLILFFCLGWS